jgi:DNA adenine methylase
MNNQTIPRPIVKWAGGKGKLLSELWMNRPPKFDTYFEPFVGGGAFFFDLFRRGLLSRCTISDANEELIDLYLTVRDKVEEVISELSSGKYVNNKEVYYRIRAEEPTDSVLRAARFIYLNRTCYNGLYRVNAAGKFNVPFGRYANPKITDVENLRAVSDVFKTAEIITGDFEVAVASAKAGDFIYFDPPYAPISDTVSFTTYTKAGFDFEEQKRLAQVFAELDERGCYVLGSNSATVEIRDLYSEHHVVEVFAARAISSDPSTRGKIPELLIRNYQPTQVQMQIDDF